MAPELIVNLWAYYDADSGIIYALAGRAYSLTGTDEERLHVLRLLSAGDYVTAKRYKVPERFTVEDPDGSEKKGFTIMEAVYDPSAQLFEEMFKNIESDLPPLPRFSLTEFQAEEQSLPADPLCVVTVLHEDGSGNVRPIITDEDRAWINGQEAARRR